MTAVIYARYSSDNQREESIEGQIRECTAYAASPWCGTTSTGPSRPKRTTGLSSSR